MKNKELLSESLIKSGGDSLADSNNKNLNSSLSWSSIKENNSSLLEEKNKLLAT
jgi:hypothetical protein